MLRAAAKPAERPNVLLLFSDQHHAGVMGCAGHATVRTPHLDRLAREGYTEWKEVDFDFKGINWDIHPIAKKVFDF